MENNSMKKLGLIGLVDTIEKGTCQWLRDRIFDLTEELCKYFDTSDRDLCKTKNIIQQLCRYLKEYRKSCCRCVPKCEDSGDVWTDVFSRLSEPSRIWQSIIKNSDYTKSVNITGGLGGSNIPDLDLTVTIGEFCQQFQGIGWDLIGTLCTYYKEYGRNDINLCDKNNKFVIFLERICNSFPQFFNLCCG